MQPKIRLEDDSVVFAIDNTLLQDQVRRDLVRWIDDCAFFDGVEPGIPPRTRVKIRNEFWDQAATIPSEDDSELADLWANNHRRLTELLGIRSERIVLESQGYVGSAEFYISLRLNGDDVDLSSVVRATIRTTHDNSLRAISPAAEAVVRELLQLRSAVGGDRAAVLQTVGRIQAFALIAERALGGNALLEISLDEHLAQFEIEKPAKFRLGWRSDDSGRLSLKLEADYGDDKNQDLDVDRVDAKAALINKSAFRAMLLSEGAAAAARVAAANQHKQVHKLALDAVHNPFLLLPEGVVVDDLELAEYSGRVIGFEPATPAARAQFAPTGIEWYQSDDIESPTVRVATAADDGREIMLDFATPDNADACAERIEASIGQTVTLKGGCELRATQGLADRVRAQAQLVRSTGTDAESGSGDGVTDSEPVSKRRRMQAVLADARVTPPPGAPSADDLEDQVPWPVLSSVLSPKFSLLPHQRRGVAWLWHRYSTGQSGAFLADDMGLGKTLQIACLLALARLHPRGTRGAAPSLVVAPTILIANWVEELRQYFQSDKFPGRVLPLHGTELARIRKPDRSLDVEAMRQHDIIVTNYEALAQHQHSLLRVEWHCVVLDEAHAIKNPATARSTAARGLSGGLSGERPRKFDFAICSTGTPVENRIEDLWAQYDFLSPGVPFTAFNDFRGEYGQQPDAPRRIAELLSVGTPRSSILRRTKADVLKDKLPGKTYVSLPVSMTSHQMEQEKIITRAERVLRDGSLGVLSDLQKLYQHPQLLNSDDGAERWRAPVEDLVRESPKLRRTVELLREIQLRGEKAIVFTLWTQMQALLVRVLMHELHRERTIHVINGEPSLRKNALRLIADFSRTEGFDVIVLSPLAAGSGLNIVAANHVIHYGRWWNPAKEDQATDRAHRIGQARPVTVYYPLLHHPGSPLRGFDIKLNELVARKREVSRQLFDPIDTEITSAELLDDTPSPQTTS